ncbi:MAG: carboxypeptidase regulatory-like domain-containing protein, partial [Acidobacteriota bacterium]
AIVTLATHPPGATVHEGGTFIGTTPMEVVLDVRSHSEPREFKLELEGYAASPANVTTPAAGDDALSVTLSMEPGAELSLRVLDGQGRPVERARVSVSEPGGHRFRGRRTATDDTGTATVSALVPGTFDLEVSADGFRLHRRTGLDLGPGIRSIETILERGVSLVGRVLEPSGAPAGESMVRLEQANGSPMSFMRSRAFSDSDGRFSLDGLDAGAHTVVAQHATWGEVKERVEVGPDGATVELRFSDDGASVAGLVLDGATGEAVVGARVQLLQGETPGFFGGGQLQTKTDFEGRFRFAVVPAGTYRPVASHDGYAATKGEAIEVDELSVDGVTLELGGGEAIVGRVTGVPFERLGSLSLMALSSTGGLQHATPDFEGAFRFGHLAPGAWTVRASLPDGAQVTRRVMLAEGDGEVEIELELGSGITVSGQVLRAGAGASGLAVRASHKTATGSAARSAR